MWSWAGQPARWWGRCLDTSDCALPARLEAQHQALVTLWHQLHTDMKSLLAWQSLSRDVQLIRSWSLVTVRRPCRVLKAGGVWGLSTAMLTPWSLVMVQWPR